MRFCSNVGVARITLIKLLQKTGSLCKSVAEREGKMSDKTVSSLKPKALLKELSRRCPGIWEHIKHFRRGKEQALLNWPDWCYMPIAAVDLRAESVTIENRSTNGIDVSGWVIVLVMGASGQWEKRKRALLSFHICLFFDENLL